MYKAVIYFEAYEDSYEDGEIGNIANHWDETLTAKTKKELRELIEKATYNEWKNIEHEDINEYPKASEYWTSYLADEDNQGDAYPSQIEEWKAGKLRLWAIRCHILVSKVTETKAVI